MKKLFIFGLLVFSLVSCDANESYSVDEPVCNCIEREKLQNFISDKVIKASNNMSDEEMEDVIRQLERTGITIYCHRKQIYYNQTGNGFSGFRHEVDYAKTKLDSCETIMY